MLVAVAATASVSCTKKDAPIESAGDKVAMRVSATSVDTKVVFGAKSIDSYPLTWSETGEKLAGIEVVGTTFAKVESKGYATSNEGKNANFDMEFDAKEGESFDYHFVSPSTAINNFYPSQKDMYLTVPVIQTSGASSVDPAAIILYSNVTGRTAQGGDANVNFSHLAAYAKLTLKNTPLKAGETVESVNFKATNKKISAGFYYYYETGSYKDMSTTTDNITISTKNVNTAGSQFDVWFSCIPFELEADDELVITVKTDQTSYSRTITMDAGKSLDAGVLSVIPVNMSTATEPKDFSGSFVLAIKKDSKYYAMSNEPSSETSPYRLNSKEITYSGSGSINTNDDSIVWTSTKVGSSYSLTDCEGKYLSWSSGNYAELSDKEYLLDYTQIEDSVKVTSHVSAERVLSKNNSNAYFAFYGNSGQTWQIFFIPAVLSADPTIKPIDNPALVPAAGGSVTVDYIVKNAVAGKSVSASTSAAWISGFDYSVAGKITFNVAENTSNDARSATVTVSYPGATSVSFTVDQKGAASAGEQTFIVKSSDVVTGSAYNKYEKTLDGRSWAITFGGNNKSVGTNSSNRSKCNLSASAYTKYAVSPVTTTSVASAFACKTKLDGVKKISYTIGGGSNQTNTKVYLVYSADDTTYSQVSLTSGEQGATISSGTEFVFNKCDGYFALVFAATNTSGNWRIDDVDLTFTYEE